MGQHCYQAALFVVSTASRVHIRQAGGNARHRATKRPDGGSDAILNMLTNRICEIESVRANIDDHDDSLQKLFWRVKHLQLDLSKVLCHTWDRRRPHGIGKI